MSQTFIESLVRLQDPWKVASSPRQLHDLQKKVADVMTGLYRQPKNGGNPFLFALAGPKPHFLCRKLGGSPLNTAATDGKRFFWNPEFLEKMDMFQAQTVMMHESYHVLFLHCDGKRGVGKEPGDFNIALDYVVNGVIDHDHVKSGRSAKYKLWGGPLGAPVLFKEFIEYIEGKRELPDGMNIFADAAVHGRSPESIYTDIVEAKLRSPRRCKEDRGGCGALSLDPKTGKSVFEAQRPAAGAPAPTEGPWGPDSCPKCGAPPNHGPGSLDSHTPSGLTKDEVMGEMMRAAEQAEQMRGSVPAEIEAALAELQRPTLRPRDIIRHCFQRKAQDVGSKNDYRRYRKRFIAMGSRVTPMGISPTLYIPRKYDHTPKWICLLDTSGSMSDQDIANGLKEMQAVPSGAEGWIVPCDAATYWDAATKITSATDIKRTKIVGRGGTVFDQFFEELPRRMGRDFDVVVIVTDGDCGQIDPKLHPGCDVLWVITNKREFKPNFGRVVQLNPYKP